MNLIVKTWRRLLLRKQVHSETPITAVLRNALIEAYDKEGRDWFIALEDPLTDPEFGTETGRNDLNFYPPARYRRRQTVFFTLECKRLHVTTDSGFQHKCGDYFVDGVQRFVDGKYSRGLEAGGMLGYVMDCRLNEALSRIHSEALSRAVPLKLGSPPRFSIPSTKLSAHRWSADSIHDRDDGEFTLHHVLVALKQPRARASRAKRAPKRLRSAS